MAWRTSQDTTQPGEPASGGLAHALNKRKTQGRTVYPSFSDPPILGKAFLSPESCDDLAFVIPEAESLQAETPRALSFKIGRAHV